MSFLFLFSLSVNGQSRIQYDKSKILKLDSFGIFDFGLNKIIEDDFYTANPDINFESLKIVRWNMVSNQVSQGVFPLKALNVSDVTDYLWQDSMLYLLANNSTRFVAYNFNSETIEREVKVHNLHSNLYEYTNIHVYGDRVFLLYDIDISPNRQDSRNVYVDELDSEGRLRNLFSIELEANYFTNSSYKNLGFYKSDFFYSDIVSGAVYKVDLESPLDQPQLMLKAVFDHDSSENKRVRFWKENYLKTKNSMALMDSIRHFYDSTCSATYLTFSKGQLVVLDKLNSENCASQFRLFNFNDGHIETISVVDSTGKCILEPNLNLIYFGEKAILVFLNYYEPGKGKCLRYLRFEKG